MCKCANVKATVFNLQICTLAYLQIKIARALGFEPRSRVLETRMLAVAPCPYKRAPKSPEGDFETLYLFKELLKQQSTQACA